MVSRSDGVWHGVFDIKPTPKARARVTSKGWAYTPKKTKTAETEFKRLLAKSSPTLFKGPVGVFFKFIIKRPKSVRRALPSVKGTGDLDNLTKLYCDAANGILWDDDSQIVLMECSKLYGDSDAVKITVYSVDDGALQPRPKV